MKRIPLTQGYFALVDDEDYFLIAKHKWHLDRTKGGRQYAQTCIELNGRKTTIRMHRMVARCRPNDGSVVDHRNGLGLDNRRCNLRKCTQSENLQNQRPQDGNSSRFKGVSFDKKRKRWRATIFWKGQHRELATTEAEEDAAILYDVGAQLLFGEFARINGV